MNDNSTANIREWWDSQKSHRLPLALRSRFATLLIRCEQLEVRVDELAIENERLHRDLLSDADLLELRDQEDGE